MARRTNPLDEKNRRNQLLQAAYQAIYVHGYASVTLNHIAAEAGLSKGALLYYFSSKDELFLAALSRFARIITVSTARAMRLEQDPVKKLEAFVNNQFYGLTNTKRFYTVYLDLLSASTKKPALRAVTQHILQECQRYDLQLAQLNPCADPEGRAKQIRALIDGLAIRFVFDDDAQLEQYRHWCLTGLRALLQI